MKQVRTYLLVLFWILTSKLADAFLALVVSNPQTLPVILLTVLLAWAMYLLAVK